MKLFAKQVDDTTNRDMCLLYNSNGWCVALCHIDCFQEDDAIQRELSDGLDVTLEVSLATNE